MTLSFKGELCRSDNLNISLYKAVVTKHFKLGVSLKNTDLVQSYPHFWTQYGRSKTN